MSLFELLSFTDDEIDLITSALCRWSEGNHIDVQSAHGQAALRHAIALVSAGIQSPDSVVARLDEVCSPPAHRSSVRGS
ncbi:hypothetical protein GGE12_000027 [Rhizobium mongolense]|uniref:Uncharacterized protein n=1 Tax=Rhizobium mongolense TaxID=57676 RepID=A0A7W6WBZ8_9HYPH|nr:hypothetical protein [Rhizobium mongolense]